MNRIAAAAVNPAIAATARPSLIIRPGRPVVVSN